MKFSELSERAKQHARSVHAADMDQDWHDFALEDIRTQLKALGFLDVTIYYSGFWSQGDGASFVGIWRPKHMDLAKLEAEELRAEATQVSTTALLCYPEVTVELNRIDTHYCHPYTVGIMQSESDEQELEPEEMEDLVEWMRDLMRWAYRYLEAEYNYQTSDESIAELGEDYDEQGYVN